jgi:membrane associated rhomboid family serine protease
VHLLGNMLFLWIFGNNVEDRLGAIPFALFYLVGGIAAALTQVVIDPQSTVPLVGAPARSRPRSGRTSSCSRARILSLVFLGFFYQLLEVPAPVVLGYWFVLQLVSGFGALGAETARAAWRSSPTSAGSSWGSSWGSSCASRGVGADGAVPRPADGIIPP